MFAITSDVDCLTAVLTIHNTTSVNAAALNEQEVNQSSVIIIIIIIIILHSHRCTSSTAYGTPLN